MNGKRLITFFLSFDVYLRVHFCFSEKRSMEIDFLNLPEH
jgi:hypothetical protein